MTEFVTENNINLFIQPGRGIREWQCPLWHHNSGKSLSGTWSKSRMTYIIVRKHWSSEFCLILDLSCLTTMCLDDNMITTPPWLFIKTSYWTSKVAKLCCGDYYSLKRCLKQTVSSAVCLIRTLSTPDWARPQFSDLMRNFLWCTGHTPSILLSFQNDLK